MAKKCNNCDNTDVNKPALSVPFVVHESMMVRAERSVKRMWFLVLVLVLLLVGSNAGWLVYESQFETVEMVEEYTVEQDSENGNTNSIINGGEIINGEAESDL